ncbi:hypothetical protein [Microbispora sp. NPDC046933]|uniref:hypothetical protein n=1 Tax=Microbispora sp. NPDC046933 TaxID=3155618 RepID=UPI0033E5B1A9
MLLAIVTIAHLSAHTLTPHHHSECGSRPAQSCDHHPVPHHHDAIAHPDAFPVPECQQLAVAPATAPRLVIAESAVAVSAALPPPAPGRDPPCGHRARSVRTHTLEVYRP